MNRQTFLLTLSIVILLSLNKPLFVRASHALKEKPNVIILSTADQRTGDLTDN